MVTIDLADRYRYDRIGTLDIETSGFDGRTDDLVAIGVGYYDATSGENAEVKVHTRKSVGGDERDLIRAAYEWLNDRGPDCLTSYKGKFFDLTFLDNKVDALGFSNCPPLECAGTHVDLFPPRKRRANELNQKWPSLEESLDSYGIPEYETDWEGEKLTNTRFGEDLAPRYVNALVADNSETLEELESVVVEYTETDVEANIALYEADVGREYVPTYVSR